MLAIFTGLLGTLIGLFLGNRLALGREKRKEFNEVALPIFENLEHQLISAKSGTFPYAANSFEENSLVLLKQHISSCKAKKLDLSMEKYNQAKKSCGFWNSSGEFEFNKPEELVGAIEEIQKYVLRK